MYDDDDPFLPELREICLALPEAVEKETWGRPTFRAGKIFAIFAGEQEHPYGVVFKPEDDEGAALVQDSRFYPPRYWGPYGWLALDFSAAAVDWAEVAELVETSYRQIALKRMLAILDSR
jgi:predicted DNA-binding protein (MmcQ/YjbR family)